MGIYSIFNLDFELKIKNTKKEIFIMMTFMVIVVLASLVSVFLTRNRIATLTGLSADTITRVCVMLFFCLIAITGFRSCATSTTTGGSGSSIASGIWVLLIILSGVAAVIVHSNNPRLAYAFAGTSVSIIFLVLLGKFDNLFSWKVIGLPIFAFGGIWLAAHIDARMKYFLYLISGVVLLYWLFLFYEGHPIGDTGFIKRVFFPDDMAKGIFVIFLTFLFLAIWKRALSAWVITFILLASFLGNGMINGIFNRFPEKLTPSISDKTKKTLENIWDSVLREANNVVAQKPSTQTPPPPRTQAPASTPTVSKPAPTSQPVPAVKSTTHKTLKGIVQPTKAYIPNPGGVDTKRLPAGRYQLLPPTTLTGLKNGPQIASNGWLTVANDNELVYLSLPLGQTGEIEIIPQ